MALKDEIRIIEETDLYYKLLLSGDPGAGKTVFAAGSPEPIWFDSERSVDTLRFYPEYRGTPYVKVRSISGSNRANRWSKYKKLVKEAVESGEYGTIVIDTVKGQSDICVDEICAARGKELPDWPEWNLALEAQTEFYEWLQDCDIHCIYLSHSIVRKDKNTGALSIESNLPPGTSAMLYRMVNVAGYMEVNTTLRGETTRKLLVTAGGKADAKNRLRIKDAYIEDPTFPALVMAPKDTSPAPTSTHTQLQIAK
jgi:hypothetical protein